MNPRSTKKSFLSYSTLLIGLGAFVLIGACQKDRETFYIPGKPYPGPYDDSKYAIAADYFPMKFGSVWYYSVFSKSGSSMLFDYPLEGRIDSFPYRTNYYRMPGEVKWGWMNWGVSRTSAINAGGGVLFHTRLLDSAATYEEVMGTWDKHQQVQWGGLHWVSTPIGEFQCIRNDHRYYEGDTSYQARYFAMGVGYIKQEKFHFVNGVKYMDEIQIIDSTSLK
ncbi:MAG TPA: hypothetical protein DIW47_11270 [Bacteroidetes bacterium]|nr:hypothetical protein [Bacteroidota bacterium]